MLRMIGWLVVVVYSSLGALLLVTGEGLGRMLGFLLVSIGILWVVVDLTRRPTRR